MISRWIRLAWMALVGLLLTHGAFAQEAPDALVRRVSVEVLDKIRSDKALQAGDLRRLSDLVDGTVMPYLNFSRMTASAVGREWRSASDEQKRQLEAEFRILLLRTYSGALSSVSDQSVRLKPMRADPADTEVVVRTEIVQPRGEPVQLDYRLEKSGDGWRIYDVNVLGVWLIETYRNQFKQEINARGIEGLIRSLSDKNRSFDAARKS